MVCKSHYIKKSKDIESLKSNEINFSTNINKAGQILRKPHHGDSDFVTSLQLLSACLHKNPQINFGGQNDLQKLAKSSFQI